LRAGTELTFTGDIVLRILVHPLAPLLLFSLTLAALLTTYLAAGYAPPATFETVAAACWSFLLALSIVADARRRTGIPCFDFGFFRYVFLPVVVPCYCFWSRGWRGGLTLVAIVGLWLAPYIAAGVDLADSVRLTPIKFKFTRNCKTDYFFVRR
jgi:hypothetical protein